MRRRRPERPGREPLDPADPVGARLLALRLLNRRDYAARELIERLLERGVAGEVAESVVERLVAERLVDDSRFAGHFVDWQAGRGQGPVRIAMELRERGVAGEVIEAAVASRDGRWREACRQLRRRRFGEAAPEDYKERARQARFLQYRGFSADQVRAALGNDIELDE
ncbi:MAG: regulatory protein RecX [Steroidobacteraceae bacterium]